MKRLAHDRFSSSHGLGTQGVQGLLPEETAC